MRLDFHMNDRPKDRSSAFTLAEVAVSMAIVVLIFGGILVAYIQSCKRAEWTGYSLAAQGLAIQQLEQARCAQWDPCVPTNQFTNLVLNSPSLTTPGGLYTYTGYTWTNLDMPTSGSNFVRATNWVTIKMLASGNVRYQLIKVDTVWPFVWRSTTNLFTNSIGTFIAPDNRDYHTL
jgi:hypothetical protein